MGTVDVLKDTAELQSLLDDVDSFIYDRATPTVSAAEYVSTTSDGGAAIQAAINDLPSRGGTVFVPAVGPDDGITNGQGNPEDGVWAVSSTINTESSGVNSVQIVGAAPGWGANKSGAALVANGASGTMLRLKNGFLDGVRHLRVDGADTGVDGLTFGTGNNDFVVVNSMFQNCNIGIRPRNGINVWLHQNWIENCTRGIDVDSFDEYIWMNNLLFFNNDHDFYATSAFRRGWLHNSRSEFCNDTNIFAAGTYDEFHVDNFITVEPTNAFMQVGVGETIRRSTFENVQVFGGGTTTNVITNDGGFVDSKLEKIQSQNLTGSKYTNIVNATAENIRLTIDGLGYSSTDPATGGEWNGNGEEGLRVLWDDNGTPTLAEYVNGNWYNRAL